MKKLKGFKLFLAIVGGLIFLMAAFLVLESWEWITIPDIESIRLHRHVYSFGAPEYFHLPCTYSRLWDLTMLPIFIGLLLWSWHYARYESNLRLLFLEALVIMAATYSLTTSIITAIGASVIFTVLSGYTFGEMTAIFLSVVLGFAIGVFAFGLLFGILLSLASFLVFRTLKLLF